MRNQLYLSLLLCIFCPAIAFTQVDLNKGLAAYYPFNGNANDESGNGNNPIFNNATLTADYHGNANSAYYFNGIDNYMEIPNSGSLNFNKQISLCALVKPAGYYTGKCYNNMIIAKQINDYMPGNYSLRFADAVTGCTSDANTETEVFFGPDGSIGTSQTPVELNTWYSVVFTSDGITAKLYVNCELVVSEPATAISYTNPYNLFLGHFDNVIYPYWLNGDLDEIRIYNRPLNSDEVKAYSFSCADKLPCSNWAYFAGEDPGVQIGDLDIPGDKITVEAMFNRTDAYDPAFYGGDIVSKHTDPTDVNYLLRPTRAEITTTTGWHGTPDVCEFEINKTYHAAMVYDGQTLKFYRNGFLMGQTPCTGDMVLNDWITRFGSTAAPSDINPSDFYGYINEVRIWNIARTQNEIRSYMDKPLPNPSSQNGLLAYYTFDDLKNKQGNSQWDGSLINNASINQTNPECNFAADSCDDIICDLTADFSYFQSTCDPKKVIFENLSVGADSIRWDFGNGQTAGNIEDTVIQYTAFGSYTVKLFAKNNAGCLDTAEYIINVTIKKDSAIINKDTSICAGTSIQLDAIDGLQYCWSPSAGLSNTSVQNPLTNPLVTTTYYLNILTEADMPVIRDSITINVIPLPDVKAGNDVSVCKGSSVQLNASGAIMYKWNASPYLSDTTIPAPVATLLDTTSFIVTGYSAEGCASSDTVEVFVLPLPLVELTNDTAVCTGGSVLLQANSGINNKYNWAPSAGLSDPNIYNPVASPADSTEYYVTVTDLNGCKSADSVTVNVLNVPTVSTIKDTTICQGKAIILNTVSSYANIFYWSPQTGLNDPHVQSPQASPLTTALYKVSAGNGICSKEDSVLVTVLSLPLITTNNDTTVCGNAFVQLNASGGSSYIWSPSIGLSDPNISDPVASPVTTTTYFVTGTASNSCTNTDSVVIGVQPAPAFSITPQNASVCVGDSTLLTAAGGDIYNWSPVQTVLSPISPATKVFPSANTVYKVTITNSICKVTDSLTAEVAVEDLPVITISKSNDIDCLNLDAQLIATGGMNYQWSPSTYISNTQIYNPVVDPPVDTWYSVAVKGENSCSDEDSIFVKSTFNPDAAAFEIANAFTPNHDGLNDCFSVRYWGPADIFDISIYNRWGQLVYHSNNINSCWDGTLKGLPQMTGTYAYQISISSKCSNGMLHKKGTLVLIR